MNKNESLILQIVKIKAHALQLLRDKKINRRECDALNRQLDALILEHVEPSPSELPHGWLNKFNEQFPDLPLEPLIRFHQSDHSATILELQKTALRTNAEFLDLSDLYPELERIPLTQFRWRKKISQFHSLASLFSDRDSQFEELTTAARSFFEITGKIRIPARFPSLSPGLINRLMNQKAITPQAAEGLAFDLDRISVALKESQKLLTASFFEGTLAPERLYEAGENGYRLLMNRLQTWEPTRGAPLDHYVIQWPGPGFPELAEAWLKGRGSQKKFDLIMARTGIDVQREPEKWNRWLSIRKSRDRLGQRNFHRRVFEDRLVYESLFILACGDLLDDRLETHWWPILRPDLPELDTSEEDTQEFLVQEAVVPHPAPKPETDSEDRDFMPEDEPEHLEAPAATVTKENERVLQESTWNNLFKPFLVENWMGMIGAFSLLAAWLFFSLYFWDVGAIFRILVAGALPLSLFTVGTGWAAKWIYGRREQGASTTAALLFAFLCHGSIPFNFIIAYSLFALQTGIAVSLGILLGVAQVGIVFLVSSWMKSVLKMSQRSLILMLDGPMILPFLVSLTAPERATMALTLVLFAGLVVLFLSLRSISGFESRLSRMNGILAGAHYLLLNGILYLYFRAWPEPAVLAAWFPCLALGLSLIGRNHPYIITAGAALSVLGNLIGLGQASFLPVSLAFTLAFWWHQRGLRHVAWINEVLVLYLGLFSLSWLNAGEFSWIWSAPFLIPVLAAAYYLEKRADKQEIKIVSLGLLPLMVGFAAMTLTGNSGAASILSPCLIIATAIYAYLRYVTWFRGNLWILNLFLATGLLGTCLPFPWNSPWAPFYLGLMALLWSGLSSLLSDRLNRQHRTTILLGLSLSAAVIHLRFLWLDSGFNPMVSAGILMTLFTFYTAARRSHSALPVYLALALAGIWIQHTRASFGLHGKSGLGSATAALVLLVTATLLDRRGFAPAAQAELFFMRPFFFQTKRFLAGPLTVGALVVTAISLYKTFVFFAPIPENPKVALALLLNTFLFLRLALMFNNPWLTNLAPITAIMFFICGAITLPWEVRAHVGFLYAIAFTIALDILKRRGFSNLITGPLGLWHRLITALAVLLGLLFYLLYPSLPLVYTLSYGAIAVGFLHLVAVRRMHAMISHVVLLHLFTLFGLLLLRGETEPLPVLLVQLTGGFILLMAPIGYLLESATRDTWKPYQDAFRWWLPILGLSLAIVCLSWSPLMGKNPPLWYPAAAYLFLHLGNRYGNHRLLYFFKGFTAWQMGHCLSSDPLVSLLLAMFIFTGIEWLLSQTKRWSKIRLQGEFPEGISTAHRTAPVLIVLSVIWLGWHLAAFFEASHGFLSIPHYLIFALIPYMFFFYKHFGSRLFAFVGIGLVAYGCGFIFLGLPWPEALVLTPLHGLNLGLLLALVLYFTVCPTMRKRGHVVQAGRVEKVSVFLTVLIICSATLSFVAAHRLSEAFQARFLVSAFILICTALYLRFGIQNVTTLHGALYRIATTMAFWSVGLFLAPFPAWILYLILLPGLFFLFRIEVKAGKTPREDMVAAGILLALTVFLTLQIQPLQVILFPEEVFHWKLYYQNSPVLIIAGLGLMRLHKHAVWPGLCLLGTFLSLMGLFLLATIPIRAQFGRFSESLVLAILAHAVLLFFFVRNPVYQWFLNWTGLRREERNRYRTQIFWLLNLALQGSILFLVFFHDESPSWTLFLLPVSVAGLLYQVRSRTLAPAILETAILAFPVTAYAFPSIPLILFAGVIGTLILIYSILRRIPTLTHLIPNLPFLLLVVLFLALVIRINPISPIGLALFSVPFLGWVAMPARPFAIPRQKHLLGWPFVSALVVFCLNGGYRPELLTVWALACLYPPVVLLMVLRTTKMKEFSVKSGWFFLSDWAKTPDWTMALVITAATGICITDFLVNQSLYLSDWVVISRTFAVLGLAMIVFLLQTLRQHLIKTAIITEVLVWLILGLVRWKLDVMDTLELGSPIDGYLLLGLGVLIAGIREAVRTRVPKFEAYFHKTSQLYVLAGWVYSLYLQVTNPGAFHGEIGSVVLALFYSWIARRRAKSHLLPAFLFGNIALLLFFFRLDRDQILFYLLPTLSSALVLAQLFKEELGANRVKLVRMVCGLVMLAATAIHNVLDFDASLWFPVTAALVSALIVVAGIALRVRIYLFMGSSFFVLNTIASLIHVVRNQAPDQTKLLIGAVFLVTGILFTGGFLFFQMKRQELLDQYNRFMRDLKKWE